MWYLYRFLSLHGAHDVQVPTLCFMAPALFWFLLLALPLSLLAGGASNRTEPSVLIRVSTPSLVRRRSEFVVQTTVINTGKQTVWLLKHPHGVLRPSRSDTFAINSPEGRSPKFIGAKMKYSPESAAAREDGNACVVLAPGEQVIINHDLIRAYNVAPLGPGQYDVRLRDVGGTFYVVDPQTRQVMLVKATIEHENASINVSGDFVAARKHTGVESRHHRAPRELLAGCTIAQMNIVQTTVPIMVNYVNGAQQFMRNTGGQGLLYTKWFGTHDIVGKSIIATTFERMSDNQFNAFTYNCGASAPDCTDPDDVAYVEPEVFGVINLCPRFFSPSMSAAGYDSRASSLVHEASYFAHIGATDAIAYGAQESLALALRDPARAVSNACNYEYFSIDAFDSPPQTGSGDEVPAQEVLA